VRVLGVDPGLTRCGLGVVSGSLGRPLSLVEVSVVRSGPEEELPARLLALSVAVREVVLRTDPDVMVVERMFSQHNVQSVMGTAQAAAAAVLIAAEYSIPVRWHTPTEVKAAVTGSGQAGKAQVAGMVCRVLKLGEAPKPVDATDALALAICQIWRGQAQDRIAQAVAGSPPSRIPVRAARSAQAPAPRHPVRAVGSPGSPR
jgi:crossover junction endodeoxyribonuclease RuvC